MIKIESADRHGKLTVEGIPGQKYVVSVDPDDGTVIASPVYLFYTGEIPEEHVAVLDKLKEFAEPRDYDADIL